MGGGGWEVSGETEQTRYRSRGGNDGRASRAYSCSGQELLVNHKPSSGQGPGLGLWHAAQFSVCTNLLILCAFSRNGANSAWHSEQDSFLSSTMP